MKEEEAFFPALVKEHFTKKEEDAIVEVSQSVGRRLAASLASGCPSVPEHHLCWANVTQSVACPP